MKNLDLAGNYEAYADPYADITGNLFGSSIFEVNGAPGYSYMGYCLDDLADDGNEYYTVPAAEWGSGQASDWTVYSAGTGSPAADNVINDLPYAACLRMQMGMQAGNMSVMVHHGGESDALDGTSEEVYKTSFAGLIAELRAVRGSGIPLIIVGLHQWTAALGAAGASEENWNNVNTWRQELASSISNAVFVDISDIPAKTGDEFHIAGTNHPTIGVRVSEAIQTFV
jgi:hypothetical protein